MARVVFARNKHRQIYFDSLKKMSGKSWSHLASELQISLRQLSDWRKGITSASLDSLKIIKEKYNIYIPSRVIIKKDNWHLLSAARKGGIKTAQLYGSIGTPDGRRKGGLNAIKALRNKGTPFVFTKEINIPPKDDKLSEIVGAFIGDGSISKKQARIYLNLKTDRKYAQHLANLVKNAFKVNVSISLQIKRSTVEIWTSSVRLSSHLHKLGLPIGDKNEQGLDIPKWIVKSKRLHAPCLRGIFDTDGCTYIDKHHYKNKVYKHIGIAYTTYSPKLIATIAKLLAGYGYVATLKSKNRVFVRRTKDVIDFFDKIKPANERHVIVYNKFMEGYRSGRNGSASKAAV